MFARIVALAAVITFLSLPASAQTPAPAARDYLSELRGVRPSTLPDGTIVISIDALAGDLRGLLTLTLTEGPDGTTGSWAFSVKFLEDLRSDLTPIEPIDHVGHAHDEPDTPAMHREYTRFRRDGMITGSVTAAELRRTVDGSIEALTSASLVITGGSQRFESATGSGRVGPWPTMPDVLTLLLSF